MKKILIVDDDEGILDALSTAVESEGYEAVTLLSGDQILAKVKEHNPDMILLDLLLSGKDGGELAIELKARPETKHIPIIILSAHPTAGQKAQASGADAFLAKPFDIHELFTLLAKYTQPTSGKVSTDHS